MVVAGNRQHAAVPGAAGEIRVLERVHRSVDAWTLAVPDAEDAVEFRRRVEIDLLAPPQRRGGEVLVDAGLEMDVVRGEVAARMVQRGVVHRQRRATIARDETGGVQAGGLVALLLQHWQPDQRLHAGQEYPPRRQGVFIVQRYLRER